MRRFFTLSSGAILFANFILLMMFITAFTDWAVIFLLIALDVTALISGAGIILVINAIKEYRESNKRDFEIKERFSHLHDETKE